MHIKFAYRLLSPSELDDTEQVALAQSVLLHESSQRKKQFFLLLIKMTLKMKTIQIEDAGSGTQAI